MYAVGPASKNPLRIGNTVNPNNLLSKLNLKNLTWKENPNHFWVKGWVADNRVAWRLRGACHDLLDKAGKRLDGEWFSINPEWALKVMQVAARQQNIPLYSNEQISKLSVAKDDYEFDRLLKDSGVLLG